MKNMNRSNIVLAVAVAASTLWSAMGNAGPSIYPTGATRYNPAKAYNVFVLFSGADNKTQLSGAGNLLMFDNQGEGGYPAAALKTVAGSRVLEIDPVNHQIVWEYTGSDSNRPEWTFYSGFISDARRLPNGNTFIDEGTNGRFFQVTPNGEIVWEYVSPYFGSAPFGPGGRNVVTNFVYRAQPVSYDWVPAELPHGERAVVPPDLSTFQVPAHP
jgi:hypothetical protein